jgi:uncharacterized protein DUF4383
MLSDRAIRLTAFVFAILFAIVVILGYLPGLNAPVHQHHGGLQPGEHLLMGRYAISLIDDVTHGVTALVLLVTSLLSARYSRLALIAFGWYYACDAVFYLVHGVLQHQPVVANVLLNLPHVVISSILLVLAYRGRADVPRASLAAAS